MNFHVDGKYSAFEELMHYYHISFNVYHILVLIVLVNCIKAIVIFYSLKKQKVSNGFSSNTDLLSSILAGMGLGTGMAFNGVIADISSKYFKIWGSKMLVLSLVALILFIIQFIYIQKSKNIRK